MDEIKRITFEVKANFWDDLSSQLVGIWQYRRPRIFLALTFLLLLFLAVLVTEGHLLVGLCLLSYVLGMWSLVILHRFELAINSTLDSRKNTGETKTNIIDEKKGLGFETEDSGGWLGWNDFSYIKETGRFFFLQYKTGFMHVIIKNGLPDDKILAIREILSKVPLENKYLRNK